MVQDFIHQKYYSEEEGQAQESETAEDMEFYPNIELTNY